MVDRLARDRLALNLRRLASGQITNDEFDDSVMELMGYRGDERHCTCGYDLTGLETHICPECGGSTDLVLSEVAWFGWYLYDDLRVYRLRGKDALSPQARRHVARAILFLKSDLPYRGGVVMRYPAVAVSIVVLSIWLAAMCLMAAGVLLSWGPAYLIGAALIAILWSISWFFRLWHWFRRRLAPVEPEREENLWPFNTAEELDAARRARVYLCDSRAQSVCQA